MRSIKFILLFIILTPLCGAQNAMISKEKELCTYASKIIDWYGYHNDSIYKYDTLFENRLRYYARTIPATLNWPFDSLLKQWQNMNIITSTDKLFRIYSWDNEEGGPLRNYTTIIQYKYKGKIHANSSPPPYIEGKNEYCSYIYYAVYTFKANNKIYYIVAQRNQYVACLYNDAVKAFTIENGHLNDTVAIFKTTSGLHNQVGSDFGLLGGYGNYIEFDTATQSIKIPLAYMNGQTPTKFITYRFTGKYFEKVSE